MIFLYSILYLFIILKHICHHDITEILLKVALNTINKNRNTFIYIFLHIFFQNKEVNQARVGEEFEL
jgi:hypothetical protein